MPTKAGSPDRLVLLLLLVLVGFALTGNAAAQSPISKPDDPARSHDPGRLRGGWYPWDPYQYRDYRRGVPILTGFDVEVERALARIMRVELVLPEIAWENHLAALAAGTRILRQVRRPAVRAASRTRYSNPI